MKKRFLSIILSAALSISLLAGCGQTKPADSSSPAAPAGESVTLRIWSSQETQDLTKQMCEAFAAAHPENTYTFEYGVVGEPDVRSRYNEDPTTAADVFAFPNDQVVDMVNASALYEITRNKNDITARNGEGSVGSATVGDSLYGYPMTADNGYFLYYDKSILSADDVKSMDKILEVCGTQGKKFFMDVSNGWYIASFFLGNGCTLSVDANGKQLCDFNNEKGLQAAEAIKSLTANSAFITGDDSVLLGGMGSSIAAGVSGTWNASAIKETLGDNYEAVKLPTITCGGQQVQMSSFGGYKLIGVNSLTKYPTHAMDLADWLTNEQNQMLRFEKNGFGPTNIVAANSDAVKADKALAALSAQSVYAQSQNNVLGGFWTPAEAFGAALEAKDYSKDLQTMLNDMVSQIVMS
jgi:arabinogalactan oligomer/maltooligosaccharide transport system substrate-binding protein